MKLKDSTFAIIAEKQNSISHNWFVKNSKITAFWDAVGSYYLYDGKNSQTALVNKPNVPIYTESEFEALLKAEQKNEAKADYSKKAYGTYVGGVNGVFMASPGQITPLTAKSNSNIEVKEITVTYNYALEIIAGKLGVDKGIIKIEMPWITAN